MKFKKITYLFLLPLLLLTSCDDIDFSKLFPSGGLNFPNLIPSDYNLPSLSTSEMENHKHDFSQEIIDDYYLKEHATCTSNAVYYYSCKCGLISDKTFEVKGYSSHEYVENVDEKYLKLEDNGKKEYYKSCAYCSEISDETFFVENDNDNLNTYEDYINAINNGDNTSILNIKGYVIGYNAMTTSSGFGSLYLQDDDNHGYYVYSPVLQEAEKTREWMKNNYPFGCEVIVSGSVTKYLGQYQFNKGSSVTKTGKSKDVSKIDYVNVTEDFANAANNKDKSLNKYQNLRVQIDNATLTKMDVSHLYFTVGNSNVEYNIYSNLCMLENKELDIIYSKFIAGCKATIKGIVSVYSNKFDIYPDSIDTITITQKELSDDEKVVVAQDEITNYLPSLVVQDSILSLPKTSTNPSLDSVSYTYILKNGTPSENFVIKDDVLNVYVNDDEESIYGTLIVVIESNLAKIEVEIEIEVKKQQTITIAEFIENKDEVNPSYLKGIIVADEKNTGSGKFVIADDTGYILSFSGADVQLGDEVIISCLYDEYQQLPEIANVEIIELISSNNDLSTISGNENLIDAETIKQYILDNQSSSFEVINNYFSGHLNIIGYLSDFSAGKLRLLAGEENTNVATLYSANGYEELLNSKVIVKGYLVSCSTNGRIYVIVQEIIPCTE